MVSDQKLRKMYEAGMSTTDISLATGIAKTTLRDRLLRAGTVFDKKARIAAKALGRPSPRKGATLSESTKKKLSDARKGRAVTTGYKFTAEQRERLSRSAKAAWQTPERKAQLLAASRLAAEKTRLPEQEREARARVRRACKTMLSRVLSMARVSKLCRTESLLGYTKQELRAHLEAQFRPGMSWEVRGSFEIDHKIPMAHFFRMGVFDPAVINALENLQVLTPAENRRKSDRLVNHEARP